MTRVGTAATSNRGPTDFVPPVDGHSQQFGITTAGRKLHAI